MNGQGAIRRFGVAGDPVAHSRSPQMHVAAYEALGIDADYQRLPIPAGLLAETVRALPGSGFSGINVTIPHKESALALADDATEAARAIGAANTLTFSDGRILADNTDAPGLVAALPFDLERKHVLVLGAGGTARAAIWAAKSAGAQVHVWNRTASKARILAEEVAVASADAAASVAARDVIVNATSVGMDPAETPESALAALHLPALGGGATALVDFVYRDGGSPLALAAEERRLIVVDGLDLLARQGALSFATWFGVEPPYEIMRAALG